MAREPKVGECCICGRFGKLSYEHVPPEAAFNNLPNVLKGIDEILKKGDPTNAKSKIMQRGAGAYTLCERCNSLTGHWYGKNYVDWVYQGMEKLVIARKAPTLYYNFHLLPLRVIKQIACMFFSINGPQFRKAQPDLERFVLDKKRKHLPSHLRIFTFYAVSAVRQSGVTGRLSTDASDPTSTYSEIIFPPFGYVMVFDHPPDKRLLDISWFGKFDYDDYHPIPLKIPVLPAVNYLPGDYRTQEEIDKAVVLNKQIPRDDVQAERAARAIAQTVKGKNSSQ
jgi:hypothetical protein